MKYTMMGGILSLQDAVAARITGVFTGPEKRILSPEGHLLLQADIRPEEDSGPTRPHQYRLLDAQGNLIAWAQPADAENEKSAAFGWPQQRVPWVDQARMTLGEAEYCLTMKNSQNYVLEHPNGEAAATFFHRGLTGGWDIEARDALGPEILCGVFVFCRYLEQENEFLPG